MKKSTASLISLAIVAVIVAVFFAVFRGEGKFKIKAAGAEISAEGKNPPPATAVASGVKTGKIESGGAVTAHSSAAGGVETGDIKAQGPVSATHTPGEPATKEKPSPKQ